MDEDHEVDPWHLSSSHPTPLELPNSLSLCLLVPTEGTLSSEGTVNTVRETDQKRWGNRGRELEYKPSIIYESSTFGVQVGTGCQFRHLESELKSNRSRLSNFLRNVKTYHLENGRIRKRYHSTETVLVPILFSPYSGDETKWTALTLVCDQKSPFTGKISFSLFWNSYWISFLSPVRQGGEVRTNWLGSNWRSDPEPGPTSYKWLLR